MDHLAMNGLVYNNMREGNNSSEDIILKGMRVIRPVLGDTVIRPFTVWGCLLILNSHSG